MVKEHDSTKRTGYCYFTILYFSKFQNNPPLLTTAHAQPLPLTLIHYLINKINPASLNRLL